MEWLNAVGSVASVIGLLATFYTLYKVNQLPAALKQQSRDKQLSELIDRVLRLPPAKPTIPDSTAREVEALVRTVKLYYVPRFGRRTLKTLLAALEAELGGQRQLRVVQHQLRLVRDEITIR